MKLPIINNFKRGIEEINKSTILTIIMCVIISEIIIGSIIEFAETEIIVKKYNKIMSLSDEVEVKDILVYYDKTNNNLDDHGIEGIAIDKYIACLKNKELNKESEKINTVVEKIKKYYDSNAKNFAFKYQDIYTDFTVSYNETASIFTASTIKAPADMYIYDQLSKNKFDLNEKLVYQKKFYNDGSGVVKTKPYNTEFTIKELVEYSIIYSDNVAHNMLMNRFGRKNMYQFWSSQGTKNIFLANTNWGRTSASDASIYMKWLYNFSKENEQYGKTMMNYFLNTGWKMLKGKNDQILTANKGGWKATTIHDIAIVFDDNPYILVALSNRGTSNYKEFFDTTSKLAAELHQTYWEEKIKNCQIYNNTD